MRAFILDSDEEEEVPHRPVKSRCAAVAFPSCWPAPPSRCTFKYLVNMCRHPCSGNCYKSGGAPTLCYSDTLTHAALLAGASARPMRSQAVAFRAVSASSLRLWGMAHLLRPLASDRQPPRPPCATSPATQTV